MATQDAPFSYDQATRRIQAIVQQMQRPDVPLDETLALLEEGRRLAQACRAWLDQAELRITRLSRNPDGSLAESPFDPEPSA